MDDEKPEKPRDLKQTFEEMIDRVDELIMFVSESNKRINDRISRIEEMLAVIHNRKFWSKVND